VVDSTGGRVRVLYFPVADTRGVDNFDAIHGCFQEHGLAGCDHLAGEPSYLIGLRSISRFSCARKLCRIAVLFPGEEHRSAIVLLGVWHLKTSSGN
jgi:hypothetical protein